MIILGLDPGLGTTGWGIIVKEGNRLSHIDNGEITTDAKLPLANRLVAIDEKLRAILDHFKPDCAAVEEVFVNKNPQSTLKLGQARGVVLLAAEIRGVPIAELPPAEVKRAVTGNGRATKLQIQRAVTSQCGLAAAPEPPDVADAIAIALCGGRRLRGIA